MYELGLRWEAQFSAAETIFSKCCLCCLTDNLKNASANYQNLISNINARRGTLCAIVLLSLRKLVFLNEFATLIILKIFLITELIVFHPVFRYSLT